MAHKKSIVLSSILITLGAQANEALLRAALSQVITTSTNQTRTKKAITRTPKGTAIFHLSDNHSYRNRNVNHITAIQQILQGNSNADSLEEEVSTRNAVATITGDCIDGITGMDHHRGWFWLLQFIPGFRKGIGQTEEFEETYLTPLKNLGLEVYMCDGNHDRADPTESLIEIIEDNHDNCYYTQQIGNLTLISCSMYPTEKICTWLEKQFAELGDAPVALMFHFNVEANEWTDEEKTRFFELIKDKNVQIIMNGHSHSTATYTYNSQKISRSSGDTFPVLLFDNSGNLEKIFSVSTNTDDDGNTVTTAS